MANDIVPEPSKRKPRPIQERRWSREEDEGHPAPAHSLNYKSWINIGAKASVLENRINARSTIIIFQRARFPEY